MPKKYLIGNSENSWDFESAYQDAEDGDTFIFEEGYCYTSDTDEPLFIDKSLELIGNVMESDGVFHFSNTIFSKIVVDGESNVKFSNLYFQINELGSNFEINHASKVELYCVTVENLYKQNEYFCIYAQESEFYADMLWLPSSSTNIKLNQASATIKHANLESKILVHSKSTLKLEHVNIQKFGNNVISSKNSDIILQVCNIAGGDNNESIPALYVENSNADIRDSFIEQKGFESCVFMKDNSYLHLENSEVTSVDMFNSRGIINSGVIRENLFLREASYVMNSDWVEFWGENPEKVDIYVEGYSA